jgi:hypothetical protein
MLARARQAAIPFLQIDYPDSLKQKQTIIAIPVKNNKTMFYTLNKTTIFVRNIKHYEADKAYFIASSGKDFGRNGRKYEVGAASAEVERRTGCRTSGRLPFH